MTGRPAAGRLDFGWAAYNGFTMLGEHTRRYQEAGDAVNSVMVVHRDDGIAGRGGMRDCDFG